MLYKRAIVLLSGLAAIAVAQLPCDQGSELDEPQLELIEQLAALRNVSVETRDVAWTTVVDTHIRIFMSGRSREQGNLSDADITEQIRLLNDNFHNTGFQFSVKSIDRLREQTAWNRNVQAFRKKRWRQGNYTTLNIFFQGPMGGFLGKAFLPANLTTRPENFEKDVVEIDHAAAPGGSYEGRNQGKALTHEVAHWLGLIHPWGNFVWETCESKGDYVDDTPTQAGYTLDCSPRDSCPNSEGVDSINNFMQYTDDACRTEFTAGQVERMKTMWTILRQGQSDFRPSAKRLFG